ncbi:MAG TPA: hypothetical protein PK788_08280 [Gemmatimonadaceae bacterium]|nr:hypothetical protein [Gemmatimonadaceae bacterium]
MPSDPRLTSRWRLRHLVVGVAALLGVVAAPLRAQQAPPPPGTTPQWLTVFLDCRAGGCDRNYFIQELPFVVWTQDRFDAEVHALVTELGTGAGGSEYTIVLVGQRRFALRADTLVATIPPNATIDMRRRELVRVLKVGLGPYALRTGMGPRLSLAFQAPPRDSVSAQPVKDPWNFWVYRASADGNGGAESQSTDYEISGSLSATRITEEWKLVVDTDYEYRSLSFKPDSGPTETFINRQAEIELVAIRSLTAHWSAGVATGAEVDEFRNESLALRAEAAVEWNYFPWREATSRQLTVGAGLLLYHFDYNTRTIYDRLSETRPVAKLQLASEVRQPWGSLFAGARHLRYLHDFNIFSAEVYGEVSVRVSRGLSLEFGASASKINDQLYLPAGGLSAGEILTRQRAMRTAYRMDVSAGVSYTFGSIFNTFVNPRFDSY